jgi:hypothetical protein
MEASKLTMSASVDGYNTGVAADSWTPYPRGEMEQAQARMFQ